jgi:hypothetical protein
VTLRNKKKAGTVRKEGDSSAPELCRRLDSVHHSAGEMATPVLVLRAGVTGRSWALASWTQPSQTSAA